MPCLSFILLAFAFGPDAPRATAPEAPRATVTVITEVPAECRVDALVVTPDGSAVAYRAHNEDGAFVGLGDQIGPVLERTGLPQLATSGNAVGYLARRDGANLYFVNEHARPVRALERMRAMFMRGTDVFAFFDERPRGGPAWSIDGAVAPAGALDERWAGRPLVDEHGVFVAYRQRLDDAWTVRIGAHAGERHDWVSDPWSAPDGRIVYRTWSDMPEDGRRATRIVIGGAVVSRHAWARRPVVAPDTGAVAWAACDEGRPMPAFPLLREDQLQPAPRYGDRPAYAGDTYRIYVDGSAGPAFAEVGDPVFGPDGRTIAYRARTAHGWCVVTDHEAGPEFESVDTPVFGRTGRAVAYVAQSGGERFVVIDDAPGPRFGTVRDLVGGANQFGYVGERMNGVYMVIGTRAHGPHRRIDDVQTTPDGRIVARASGIDGVTRLIDGKVGAWFDDVGPVVTGAGRSAWTARRGHDVVVVDDGQPGPAGAAVEALAFAGARRVAVVRRADGRAELHDGDRPVREAADIDVVSVADGRTITIEREADTACVVVDGRAQTAFAAVDEAIVVADGTVVYAARDDDGTAALVNDGAVCGRADTIDALRALGAGHVYTARMHRADGVTWTTNAVPGPTFALVSEPHFTADGHRVVFAGLRGRDIVSVTVEAAPIAAEGP